MHHMQAESPGDFRIVVLQKPIYDKYLLLPVKNYWTWTNTYPIEKKKFWSNPYKIEVNFSNIDNFFYENARFTKRWS